MDRETANHKASGSTNTDKTELEESSFKLYDFPLQVCETRFACEIMRMEDSIYVWIGDESEQNMNDLSFACVSKYESEPLATKVLGLADDAISSNIAKRLTKKFGMLTYVSFNIAADNFTIMGIENSLNVELKQRPHILERL